MPDLPADCVSFSSNTIQLKNYAIFAPSWSPTVGSQRNTQCGSTSAAAVTTFQRSANDPPQLATGDSTGDCTYTIRARSRRVCQLRIDFDTELAQPGTTVDRPYPHCQLDALLVDGLALELCGHNVEQHGTQFKHNCSKLSLLYYS